MGCSTPSAKLNKSDEAVNQNKSDDDRNFRVDPRIFVATTTPTPSTLSAQTTFRSRSTVEFRLPVQERSTQTDNSNNNSNDASGVFPVLFPRHPLADNDSSQYPRSEEAAVSSASGFPPSTDSVASVSAAISPSDPTAVVPAAAAAAAAAAAPRVLRDQPLVEEEPMSLCIEDRILQKENQYLIPVTDTLEYNETRDFLERFVQDRHGKKLLVVDIQLVQNPKLTERYKNRLAELQCPRETLKFHGTSVENISKIVSVGFILPQNPGMYGCGIYFATDSSKSEMYSSRANCNKLLLCMVAVGKYYEVHKVNKTINLEKLTARGYDSVYAPRDTREMGGVLFDEFIVYHKDQAIPKYVITYRMEKLPGSGGGGGGGAGVGTGARPASSRPATAGPGPRPGLSAAVAASPSAPLSLPANPATDNSNTNNSSAALSHAAAAAASRPATAHSSVSRRAKS